MHSSLNSLRSQWLPLVAVLLPSLHTPSLPWPQRNEEGHDGQHDRLCHPARQLPVPGSQAAGGWRLQTMASRPGSAVTAVQAPAELLCSTTGTAYDIVSRQ